MAGWAAVIYVVGVESSGTCPPPSAASVESLFAPCLVRVRQPPRLDPSFAPYDAPLSIPAPTPKAPGMTDEPAVAARPSVDAEATGSVASGRDRLLSTGTEVSAIVGFQNSRLWRVGGFW